MKEKDSGDEFNNCKLDIIDDINWVRKKQEERAERLIKNPNRDIEIIRMSSQINEKIEDIATKIEQLEKVLNRQRKKAAVRFITS
jgi:ferritin-like metal-binding protein YciE